MSERGEATQRTRQGKAGAAAPPGRSTVHLRLALLAVALVLPTVSLVLLGSLWLWQHGYVLYWAMGTCIAVTGAYLLERRLMLPLPLAAVASLQEGEPGDKAWTPRQEEAWADVQAFAAKAPADRMTSRDSALNLGLRRSSWWPSASTRSAAIHCCSSQCPRPWP
jgi:hypothetical protein